MEESLKETETTVGSFGFIPANHDTLDKELLNSYKKMSPAVSCHFLWDEANYLFRFFLISYAISIRCLIIYPLVWPIVMLWSILFKTMPVMCIYFCPN